MTELEILNDQVLIAHGPVAVIGKEELDRVKTMAKASPTGRARICAHDGVGDPLHEMLIAMVSGRYVRPHAHRGKSESFHMIVGSLTIVLFDSQGSIDQLVDLSAQGEGALYYRLSAPLFHTVVPKGEFAVFHETTNGPFDPKDTIFPDWAPSDHDHSASMEYFIRLMSRIDEHRRRAS